MKKKSNVIMCMILSFLMVGMVAKAASTYESVTINKRKDSVESDAVGTSKTAIYITSNNTTSDAGLAVKGYARWVGFPYTLEYSETIRPGNTVGHRETQSKDSYFYTKLVGGYKCNGEGAVETEKY